MEIHQGRTLCTLGYVDPKSRIAFAAGHCHDDSVVTNKGGSAVGFATAFQNNTPDGTAVTVSDVISDWEVITLAPDAIVSPVLPSGRELIVGQGITPVAGMAVCHFGVVTGESCGTVDRVNNGWFTMANGVVSQKGDSGGPVYARLPDGRATLIGMFICTWSYYPAAMSWQSVAQLATAGAVRSTDALRAPGAR